MHSRHQAMHNFIMNICVALTVYCFFNNKPNALTYMLQNSGQLHFLTRLIRGYHTLISFNNSEMEAQRSLCRRDTSSEKRFAFYITNFQIKQEWKNSQSVNILQIDINQPATRFFSDYKGIDNSLNFRHSTS